MRHFVRQFSNEATLSRAVTLAAAGSVIYSFTSSSNQSSLVTPLWLSRPNVADPKMSEGAARDSADTWKHSCNCLGRDAIANAAAKIGPAVVNLTVTTGVMNGIYPSENMGTGTIINKDGTILTCAHLVKYLSEGKIEVTLQDGRSFEGRVVNDDVQTDVAIVKIESKTPLPYAKLGSSGKLRPGDCVVAVGSPLALHNTVTAGIVSCADRKAIDLGFGGVHQEYLQTDCAMDVGSSGGPLVNVDGEVVGVNTMKMHGSDGFNFAIPVDSVAKIMSHFSKNGRVVRPWLGLKMIDLNDMLIPHFKEADASFPDVRTGVLILMVSPRSPAYQAGFLPGDVLVEFGGKPITSNEEVIDMMSDKVGQDFKCVVKRANNVTLVLSVTPSEAFTDM